LLPNTEIIASRELITVGELCQALNERFKFVDAEGNPAPLDLSGVDPNTVITADPVN